MWLFGGQVLYLPCSQVAHLERKGNRDYRINHNLVIERNYRRFVDVWLDEYKKYFYMYLRPGEVRRLSLIDKIGIC